jgi:hypothetical protein
MRMKYCNQTWYIATLCENPVGIAFGPPGVKITIAKIEKWFLDKTRVRNEIL